MKEITKTIELPFGYEDKETPDVKHRRVSFGKRPTGADFIKAADNSSGSDLQFDAIEIAEQIKLGFRVIGSANK